jgi:hypothetical protein
MKLNTIMAIVFIVYSLCGYIKAMYVRIEVTTENDLIAQYAGVSGCMIFKKNCAHFIDPELKTFDLLQTLSRIKKIENKIEGISYWLDVTESDTITISKSTKLDYDYACQFYNKQKKLKKEAAESAKKDTRRTPSPISSVKDECAIQ